MLIDFARLKSLQMSGKMDKRQKSNGTEKPPVAFFISTLVIYLFLKIYEDDGRHQPVREHPPTPHSYVPERSTARFILFEAHLFKYFRSVMAFILITLFKKRVFFIEARFHEIYSIEINRDNN